MKPLSESADTPEERARVAWKTKQSRKVTKDLVETESSGTAPPPPTPACDSAQEQEQRSQQVTGEARPKSGTRVEFA